MIPIAQWLYQQGLDHDINMQGLGFTAIPHIEEQELLDRINERAKETVR